MRTDNVILAVGSDEIKLFNIIADYVGARTHKRFITWCSVPGIKRFIFPKRNSLISEEAKSPK